MTWELLIPRAISSQNRSGMNKGAARYGYKTERDRWAWDITMAAKAAGIPKATTKRKVTVTRLMGKALEVHECKPVPQARGVWRAKR